MRRSSRYRPRRSHLPYSTVRTSSLPTMLRNMIAPSLGITLPFLGVLLGSASEAATHLTPRDYPREHNAGSRNTSADDDHAQPLTPVHDRFIPVSVT